MKLMQGIGGMKLGSFQDNTIDAYEYLMGMYASNAGKSGGEYYTPQEVSEFLTRLMLIGRQYVNKVYDKIIAELIQAHREKNTSNPYEIRGFEVFLLMGKRHRKRAEKI